MGCQVPKSIIKKNSRISLIGKLISQENLSSSRLFYCCVKGEKKVVFLFTGGERATFSALEKAVASRQTVSQQKWFFKRLFDVLVMNAIILTNKRQLGS